MLKLHGLEKFSHTPEALGRESIPLHPSRFLALFRETQARTYIRSSLNVLQGGFSESPDGTFSFVKTGTQIQGSGRSVSGMTVELWDQSASQRVHDVIGVEFWDFTKPLDITMRREVADGPLVRVYSEGLNAAESVNQVGIYVVRKSLAAVYDLQTRFGIIDGHFPLPSSDHRGFGEAA